MFLCHAGLLEASDPKWSYNFQKPEATTVCISIPFCCCHSTRAKLLLNVLSLGITQRAKPHKSHDQWWVCSSIVRSKPLQNTKTHTLHIFLAVLCMNRKISPPFPAFLFEVFKISTARPCIVFILVKSTFYTRVFWHQFFLLPDLEFLGAICTPI